MDVIIYHVHWMIGLDQLGLQIASTSYDGTKDIIQATLYRAIQLLEHLRMEKDSMTPA